MPKRKRAYNRLRCMTVICEKIAHSDMSLEAICKSKRYLPKPSTVISWVMETSSLAELYAYANERQADFLAKQIIAIADTEKNPNIARNRIDARKWAASKLNPKKYGDKLELNGSLESVSRDPASLETALALSALLEQIQQRAAIDVTPPPQLPGPKE
jgi:hypothetical protein